MELYYSSITNETYTNDQIPGVYGIDPTTASTPELNALGLYLVVETPNTIDPKLYYSEVYYTVVGTEAIQGWNAVPKPLDEAKSSATQYETEKSNGVANSLVSSSTISLDIWTGMASLPEPQRPPLVNSLLSDMADIGNALVDTLTAIDSATSVDEINNIVNPATGVIHTGRGGGLGPEDMNPSYYVLFESMTMNRSDTEIYIPGTGIVIPYDPGSLPPPYEFDSMGDCFNVGDYLMQIRVSSTGQVLAEFECPLNPTGQDVSF